MSVHFYICMHAYLSVSSLSLYIYKVFVVCVLYVCVHDPVEHESFHLILALEKTCCITSV